MRKRALLGWLTVAIVVCFAVSGTFSTVSAQIVSQDQDMSLSGSEGGGANLAVTPFDQAAQSLGLSPDQLAELRSELAQGELSTDHYEQLCARIAAKHLSASTVESMLAMLGISGEQANQLLNCAAMSGNGRAMITPRRQLLPPPSAYPLPPEPSMIEQRFRELDTPYKLLAMPSLKRLKQFGYDLFASPVLTFAPVDNIPVSGDYVLGPGDELIMLLWGRVNRKITLRVERDGSVLVPQIGPIEVSGLTFEQTKKLIEARVGQITGVQVDVTMGRVRTIQVFVVGKVRQPGLYTISALAHVSNALVAAGGVSRVGSLRRIELRRNNQLVRRIDLYQLLLRGDTSMDVRLEPRDTIFVPVIGPVVAVAGDVKNPAIYELLGPETLRSVLNLAGGVNAFGYAQRIQVERVENHEARVVLDVGLDNPQGQRFIVRDGDLIKVFPVLPQAHNVVMLKGNVNRPGTYQWYPGMRITDLLREGQGPAEHTFFDYALLRRLEGPQRNAHYIPVNLNEAMADEMGPANITLQPDDSLTVYSEGELSEIPTVTIRGAVRQPGTYPLTQGMKVSDLIYRAGGLKDNAYRERAELARTEIVAGKQARYIFRDINLNAALNGSPLDDQPLKAGDELFIQQAGNWHQPWVVTVRGEVLHPGPYVIRPGERLSSVLERAGGVLPEGYLPALILIRQSVKRLQQQSLDQAKARLAQEITRAALIPEETTSAQPAQAQKEKAETLTMMQNLLAQANATQATGRVVLHVRTLQGLIGSKDDIPLEPKDEIIIPRKPTSVNVLGSVYGPTAISYDPSLTVRDYINRAGGPTQGADKEHVFVVKANGEILTDQGIRESNKNAIFPLLPVISGGLMQAHLEPGDTVYVPEQLVYVNKLRRDVDLTQVIANSAQAIAYTALLALLVP